MKSANSANSSSPQRGSLAEIEGHQKATPTTELRAAEPFQEAEQTTPTSSPETPVKSKPDAPYFREDSSGSSRQSRSYSGGEEGEGLGPQASVILDDELGTRINLETILPDEGGVTNGSDIEEVELEIPNEIAGSDADQPHPPVNFDLSRTKIPSPSKPHDSGQLSEKGQVEEDDGCDDVEGVDDQEEEEEDRDVLSELKSGGPGARGEKGTLKRARSETEAGRKVSLASLVGRVRSQTLLDASVKDKHLTNKVSKMREKGRE